MTIFDLLFIAIFFCTVAALGAILYRLFRRDLRRAGRIAARLGLFLATYLIVVIVVASVTPQRVVAIGEDQCFDDFCVAVAKAETIPNRCAVTLRISSRARRRVQRAPDAAVYLIDGAGREYRQSEAGPGRPMTDLIRPGESFATVRIFPLPAGAHDLYLVVSHGGWPGWFIIGEGNSILHKPTVVRLTP